MLCLDYWRSRSLTCLCSVSPQIDTSCFFSQAIWIYWEKVSVSYWLKILASHCQISRMKPFMFSWDSTSINLVKNRSLFAQLVFSSNTISVSISPSFLFNWLHWRRNPEISHHLDVWVGAWERKVAGWFWAIHGRWLFWNFLLSVAGW